MNNFPENRICIPRPPRDFHIDPELFPFRERERDGNGDLVKNKCGRDALVYMISHNMPDLFSTGGFHPTYFDKKFGYSNPRWLVWLGLTFLKVPSYLKTHHLELSINRVQIKTLRDMWRFVFPKPICLTHAVAMVRVAVSSHEAVSIDLSMGLGGRYAHAMYVASYDDANLYVYDTHITRGLEYEKLTGRNDPRHVMKLPLETVRKRWTSHNRVWVVRPPL